MKRVFYIKKKEVAQALFMTEKESKDIAKFYTAADLMELYENFNMTSIDNEELVYYCEDRVVTFIIYSNEMSSL